MTIDASTAQKYLEKGFIDASQITKQTLGSAEGYFTKAGSSQADKLITETLNANFDKTIGNSLSENALTHMKNLGAASEGTFANKYDMFESLSKNKGFFETGGTADGMIYDFDFVDMREANKIIDWQNVPIADLSHYLHNK